MILVISYQHWNVGRGPEEITVIGCLTIDEAHHQCRCRHAKQKIFSCDMDISVMVRFFFV